MFLHCNSNATVIEPMFCKVKYQVYRYGHSQVTRVRHNKGTGFSQSLVALVLVNLIYNLSIGKRGVALYFLGLLLVDFPQLIIFSTINFSQKEIIYQCFNHLIKYIFQSYCLAFQNFLAESNTII